MQSRLGVHTPAGRGWDALTYALPCATAAARPHCMRLLAAIATLCVLASPAAAQQDAAKERRAAIARSIVLWVEDYDRSDLFPRGTLQEDSSLQPRYARAARAGKLLSARDGGSLLHLDALQKLTFYAELDADEAIGGALLAVAAAGFDKGLVDRDAAAVREIGATALLRVESPSVWYLVLRAAAGDRVPLFADLREASADQQEGDVARRVAALRLLGQRGAPVFRSTIESALDDGDARVRLAGVEAIDAQRRNESLSVLLRALGTESHPVVAQAVVRAVRRTLLAHGDALEVEERERVVAAAMRRFGKAGWRTDMDLLDFVETFPDRAAVQPLIEALGRRTPSDALADAVNKSASPRLAARCYECLRGLTGAILPIDDVEGWRAFWAKEQDNVRIPKTLPHTRGAVSTRSSFFGIAVEGQNVVFVVDTSGSMDAQVMPEDDGRTTTRRARATTRLAAAKQQLVQAVQAMPDESRFRLVTFDDRVKSWNASMLQPSRNSTRALIDLLSRLQPGGGTNVHAALVAALALEGLRFGQEPQSEVDEVFFLSDGLPTAGAVRDQDEILEAVRQANRYLHVRIHAVYTGDGVGADFLKQLAEQNDGRFVQR